MRFLWQAAGLTAAAIGWSAWLLLRGGSPVPPLPEPPVVAQSDIAALHAITLPDLDGRPQPLSQWRGRALVVNYWATWCAPCREEMPAFSKLQERHAARGVRFVGIAAEDDAGKVRAFARENPVAYPLLVGGEGAIKATRAFGNAPLAVPFTIVLDREGRLRAAVLGRVHEEALAGLLEGM